MIVRWGHKLRCPYCGSNKWEYLDFIPTKPYIKNKALNIDTDEMILAEAVCKKPELIPEWWKELHGELLTKYKCQKCKKEFYVEEGFKTKLLEKIDKCFYCQSRYIEFVSEVKGAIVMLKRYKCKHCGAFMMIKSQNKNS